MSIATELSRIQTDRNTIRAKLVELGMATNVDNLTTLATAIEGVINRGAVSVTVQEGDTYTIPAGYHNGSGTVSGVAGGGNYSLQSKTATPTKKQQNVTPDSGYYGISDVTIAPIPDAYQDVTSVTAAAGDVLTGKIFVAADGTVVTGTMTNQGTVSKTLDVTTVTYTIPKGYHSGSGTVKLVLETKTVTPSKSTQEITPASGKVLSKVTVNPIPDAYQDVTDVTAEADKVLVGYDFVDSEGNLVEGAMPTINRMQNTVSVAVPSFTIPAGYHDGGGTVAISPETKTTSPTKSEQSITPTSGKVLSKVTVLPIPEKYQDVTGVTAGAGDVLDGEIFVDAEGNQVEGTMPNKGAVSASLNTSTTSYTIPAGYHNGSGKVTITTEEKSATPTKSAQAITPTSGKVLSKVSVAAIPAAYQDVTGVTATAAHVLNGDKFVDKTGATVTGSMPNNGSTSKTIDGLTATSATIPAGYTSGGTVSLTGDIEEALAAI